MAFERLRAAYAAFRNDGGECTLAAPSADFMRGLVGFPTAAGKIVTRETAVRVSSFLAGVKMMSNDIAKMPLILRSKTNVGGRLRTQHATDDPLYAVLKMCPNAWMTSYQLRWFLASQLIMSGNSFCQIVRNQAGTILGLYPLNSWHMVQKWDRTIPGKPVPYWMYSDALGNIRRFEQSDIWHVANTNLEGSGIEGGSVIVLAKEALSVLLASDESAARQFANGLGMGGFLAYPEGAEPTEPEAQNIVDRLKRDFSGSQNAGKFSVLPGGMKWTPMTWNAKDSQLLESRQWNAREVVRVLGGEPLLVKLGLSSQSATYASASAFLEDYWQTVLHPLCVSIEQSISRDLIAPKDRATVEAKHDANSMLRGSLRERAETNQIKLLSSQMSPNEIREQEDMDTVEGLDYFCLPANSAVFNKGEIYIPGQDLPGKETDSADTAKPAPSEEAKAATARLKTVANSLAERVIRKETKGGKIDAAFVAEVLNISLEKAEEYCTKRKDGTITAENAKAELVALVTEGA